MRIQRPQSQLQQNVTVATTLLVPPLLNKRVSRKQRNVQQFLQMLLHSRSLLSCMLIQRPQSQLQQNVMDATISLVPPLLNKKVLRKQRNVQQFLQMLLHSRSLLSCMRIQRPQSQLQQNVTVATTLLVPPLLNKRVSRKQRNVQQFLQMLLHSRSLQSCTPIQRPQSQLQQNVMVATTLLDLLLLYLLSLFKRILPKFNLKRFSPASRRLSKFHLQWDQKPTTLLALPVPYNFTDWIRWTTKHSKNCTIMRIFNM